MSPSQENGSPSEGNFKPLGDKAFKVKLSDNSPLFLFLYNGFYSCTSNSYTLSASTICLKYALPYEFTFSSMPGPG